MGLGLGDTTIDHHIRSGQSILEHIIVEPLVTVGHQAHQIHYLTASY
jgi:hypothetical protein